MFKGEYLGVMSMKNSIDELYREIKENENINNDMLKDIVLIDGAIVENKDNDYKKKIFDSLEEKYREILDARLYYKIKDVVDSKTSENNREKEINTLLGNLKIWIIRIAALDYYKDNTIEEVFEKIKDEKDIEKIYKALDNIDTRLLKVIS